MYPFYEDFGNIGVFVFSIVYGIFYGFLYKKSRTGGKIQLVLYAIFFDFRTYGVYWRIYFYEHVCYDTNILYLPLFLFYLVSKIHQNIRQNKIIKNNVYEQY